MYPVSANFHTLAIQDAPKTRVRIYFIGDAVDCTNDNAVQTNGTLLVGAAGDTDSNGRIGQGGVTVTEIFNKDKNLTIGGTVSYQIGMTLVNSDGALNNFAFGRCKVYLDVYDDANSTWLPCPLGVFRIELPVKRKVQLISCTGYDQMQVLNAIADTWWNGLNFTGGLTIANILNSMVTQLGLHLSATSSTSMVNTALSFTTPPIDSVERTYRDILGWIAEATGTVAHFNRDGELDMRQYLTPQIGGNNIVIDTDTTGNQCLSIDVAEYSVSQIDALTIKLTTADQGVTVGSGTNVYTIMDNPFLYGPDVATIQGKLTPIYNRLSAYATYSPISTRLIYDWSIEAGDIIYILNNSTTYNMPIFQQKMVWRGGYVTSELISSGDTVRPQVSSGERETYRYNVEMATKVGDNEIISKINQTAEQIQIQASKVNLTGYVTFTNLSTDGQTSISGGNITTGTISADRIAAGSLSISKLDSDTQNTITTAASDASTALSNAATAQSTANSANSQEQLIYISRASGTTTQSATTTWITDTTGNQNTWTIKRPTYNSSYPVLFVATQRKNVAGTVTCTTPQIDNTTTVIDGGHITTGTIDASVVNVSNINADNIKTGTLKAITIQDTGTTPRNYWDLSGGNFVATNGTIGGFTLSSSGLSYGSIRPEGSGIGFALKNGSIRFASDSAYERYVTGITGSSISFGDNTNATPGVWNWKTDLVPGTMNVDGTSREYFGIRRPTPSSGYTASSDIVEFTDNGTNFYTIFNGDVKATGDLTVGGVLDVTPRRCYASLSSAGWYRVMKLTGSNIYEAEGAGGFIVDFNITRNVDTANNEAHKISLMATWNNIKFINEQSVSNTLGITKIRTTKSGSILFVDVYYELSTGNTVSVAFNVTCIGGSEGKFNSQPLMSVAPSPSGETVLTEYTFITTSGEKNTFTPSHGTPAFGGCWYSRNGEYVTVHVGLTDITANTNHIIGTLPVGYRPVSQCCSSGSSATYEQLAHLYVRENGDIDIWSPNTMASLDATFMWR